MKFVSRAQWGARPPKRRSTRAMKGVTTLHWNGPQVKVGGRTTWDHSRCAGIVRGIQNFHMDSRGWSDVAYNFLECPHGYTFEGRGLNVINGANGTNTGNRTNHAICSLAGEGNPFPEAEKVGLRSTVAHIAQRTGAPDRANGHRDHKSTACPGNERYSWAHRNMPGGGGGGGTLLRVGSRGEEVKKWQQLLQIPDDGIFGAATEAATKEFQRTMGLTADGIVGPATYKAMSDLLNLLASNPPEDEMWKPGTDMFAVVEEAYTKIVGRKPEKEAHGVWAWAIGADKGSAYNGMISGLIYEQRLREENRMKALEAKVAGIADPDVLTEKQILETVYRDLTERIK